MSSEQLSLQCAAAGDVYSVGSLLSWVSGSSTIVEPSANRETEKQAVWRPSRREGGYVIEKTPNINDEKLDLLDLDLMWPLKQIVFKWHGLIVGVNLFLAVCGSGDRVG